MNDFWIYGPWMKNVFVVSSKSSMFCIISWVIPSMHYKNMQTSILSCCPSYISKKLSNHSSTQLLKSGYQQTTYIYDQWSLLLLLIYTRINYNISFLQHLCLVQSVYQFCLGLECLCIMPEDGIHFFWRRLFWFY